MEEILNLHAYIEFLIFSYPVKSRYPSVAEVGGRYKMTYLQLQKQIFQGDQ